MNLFRLTVLIAILLSTCILNVQTFDITSNLKKISANMLGLNKDGTQDIKIDHSNFNNAKVYTSKTLWPLPKNFTYDNTENGTNLTISPCQINYKIQAPSTVIVQQVLNLYLIQVFKCSKVPTKNVTLSIAIKNTDQMIATKTLQEKYSITIRENGKWVLEADYYVGFIRGLQTFSQLFQPSGDTYQVNWIPITIDDQPDYLWRGLMIDTSRHFLPMETIRKTIDSLMYNKMNVLHWHIIDEDSFPMQIKTRPELSQYGSFGKVYTFADIRSIILYAKTRGVRVIPQIDTPAHTQSWGRSEQLKNIILNCNNEYKGQFDPTLDLTYQVVSDVMKYVNTTFDDDYVHFGGDQITDSCFDQRPAIKDWMSKNNISNYKALQIYYRQKQKQIWRNFTSKKAIYWANQEIDLPLQQDDVIQWWGVSSNVDHLKGRKNQVILSNYDLTYLDIGFGGRYGGSYSVFQNWRKMYSFNPKVDTVNVIGAEICMWSQVCNQYTIQKKVWIRGSVIGQRLWNTNISLSTNLLNIAQRLNSNAERMKARGYKVAPVTVGLCQKQMDICFN